MRDREPVDLVAVHIHVLAEAVAAVLFFAACAVWIIIASQPVPA